MYQGPSEAKILPDILQQKHEATQELLQRAHDYVGDINASNTPFDKKVALLGSVVHQLDRESLGVFFNEPVQIEGQYFYPRPVEDGSDVILKTIHDFGIHRGVSFGFTGRVAEISDHAGSEPTVTNEARLYHAVNLGQMTIQSPLFALKGPAFLEAPILQSSLSLCVVEDATQLTDAYDAVRRTKYDTKWANSFDELLYSPTGVNLQMLGTRLRRLESMHSNRTEAYINYINTVLFSEGQAAEILCDKLFDYVPSDEYPTFVKPDQLIAGADPTICYAPDYTIDLLRKVAVRYSKPSPTLSLRAKVNGSDADHIIHIPLSAIHNADFK